MINAIEDKFKSLCDTDERLICIKQNIPIRTFHGVCWKSNTSNKKRLVDDFSHRCCYCDDLDKFNGGYKNYAVEHFAPKSRFKDLEFDYDNLLYCCASCNSFKGDKWVSDVPNVSVIDNVGFIDPCDKAYYEHLARRRDGKIVYLSELGKYMYLELHLYLLQHQVNFRLQRLFDLTNQIDLLLTRNLSYYERKKLINIKSIVTEQFMKYFVNDLDN